MKDELTHRVEQAAKECGVAIEPRDWNCLSILQPTKIQAIGVSPEESADELCRMIPMFIKHQHQGIRLFWHTTPSVELVGERHLASCEMYVFQPQEWTYLKSAS